MEYDYENNDRHKDNKRRKKKSSLPFGCSSRFAVCAVFCVLCCVSVLIVTKWDTFSPDGVAEWVNFSDSTNDNFSINISGTSVLENNFKSVNNALMYVSDTSVVRLNHDGEKIYSDQHNFTNPLIKCSNVYSIAFNEGGADFRILSDKGEVYRGTQGSAITDCDINDTGVYGIISDQTGYLAKLSVYDKNNEFLFGYFFNDYYAVSVSINNEGTMAAVGAVNTVDGQIVSQVYLLDFMREDPLYVYTYKDQMIYEVKFVEEDKFAVLTDSLVSVIHSDSGKEVPYRYNNMVLTAYNISYGNNIAVSLSRSDDERDCSIVSIDTKGNEVGSFSTDLKVFAVDVKKDKIALLSSNKLYLYNSYGDSFGEWEVGTDAKSIVIPQEKTVYILGVSEIRKISLK